MSVFYNFINNDTTVLGLPVRVKKKIKRKKREKNVIAVTRSCRFHITSKTAWSGIRCSSVLKSSARKFSAEKMKNVVTACKSF